MNRTSCIGLGVSAVLVSMASGGASGGIVPPPWDPALPLQTLQAWTFASPTGSPFAPSVVNNPNGFPEMTASASATYLPDNPLTPNALGTGVWCLGANDSLNFFIPNYNQQFRKEIFVSIKFSTPASGAGVPTNTVTGVSGAPGTPSGLVYTVEPVSFGVSMIHYHTSLPTCEDFNVSIQVPTGLPGAVSYIEQVVVQTVCVPTPGAVGLACAGGLWAARRRRN